MTPQDLEKAKVALDRVAAERMVPGIVSGSWMSEFKYRLYLEKRHGPNWRDVVNRVSGEDKTL